MVAMYIETVPNRGSPPAILLRDGRREGNKIRKRTLANLSKWPAEQIASFRALLQGERLVPTKDLLRIERSLPHGHVELILQAIHQRDLDSLIASKRCRPRDLVVAMIVERLIHPRSKLACTRHWSDTTLAEALGLVDTDVDELHAAMDWLLARQGRIEKKLAARHLAEGGKVYHRTEDHVRAHIFLCMLAYYVEWDLRTAWAELLFEDEQLRSNRTVRDPMAPARISAEAKQNKAARRTWQGLPVHSFETLLAHLDTRTRHTCRLQARPSGATFEQVTDPTPLQARATELPALFPIQGMPVPRDPHETRQMPFASTRTFG